MIIMASPPLSMFLRNSQAPSPSNNDPMMFCTSRDIDMYRPALSEANACSLRNSR